MIQGSSDFLQTMWRSDLVDQFTVLVFPVVLGHGKRLFDEGATPRGLKLIKAHPTPGGVVVATYAPEGSVKTGSFHSGQPTEAEIERRKALT